MKFLKCKWKKRKLLIMFIFFIFFQNFSYGKMYLTISEGTNNPRPIGITSFHIVGLENMSEDIADIISNDLQNSGKFYPIKNSLKHFNNHSDLVKLSIEKNVDSVIFGKIEYNSEQNYIISYKLIDAIASPGKIIIKNKFTIDKKWLRNTAHVISDEIFEELTGLKGAFHTKIAYISKKTNSLFPYALCISDYDGKQEFIIRQSKYPMMSPSWSPDGTKLAYVTFENNHSSLVLQTLSNGLIKLIVSFPQHNGAPSFSPDGRKLALSLSKSGSLNIYVIDILSEKMQQITDTSNNNTEPSWFPDNQNIAYTSDQTGKTNIYKLNIDTGISEQLTWYNVSNQDSEVSFDGKFLVAVNIKNNMQSIIKQDLETGTVEKLTNTILDETPTLSPNGTMMICSSIDQENNMLQLSSTDGRFKKVLIEGTQIKFPAWSPYL